MRSGPLAPPLTTRCRCRCGKAFSQGYQFHLNYTLSKSTDLVSVGARRSQGERFGQIPGGHLLVDVQRHQLLGPGGAAGRLRFRHAPPVERQLGRRVAGRTRQAPVARPGPGGPGRAGRLAGQRPVALDVRPSPQCVERSGLANVLLLPTLCRTGGLGPGTDEHEERPVDRRRHGTERLQRPRGSPGRVPASPARRKSGNGTTCAAMGYSRSTWLSESASRCHSRGTVFSFVPRPSM